jgi:hypothetical protein
MSCLLSPQDSSTSLTVHKSRSFIILTALFPEHVTVTSHRRLQITLPCSAYTSYSLGHLSYNPAQYLSIPSVTALHALHSIHPLTKTHKTKMKFFFSISTLS